MGTTRIFENARDNSFIVYWNLEDLHKEDAVIVPWEYLARETNLAKREVKRIIAFFKELGIIDCVEKKEEFIFKFKLNINETLDRLRANTQIQEKKEEEKDESAVKFELASKPSNEWKSMEYLKYVVGKLNSDERCKRIIEGNRLGTLKRVKRCLRIFKEENLNKDQILELLDKSLANVIVMSGDYDICDIFSRRFFSKAIANFKQSKKAVDSWD